MFQIRGKEPKVMNTSECGKGDNPTTVSTTLLSWLKHVKFYEISAVAKQHVY